MEKENQNKLKVITNRLQISEEIFPKTANDIGRPVLNELASLDDKDDLKGENLPNGNIFINHSAPAS
jgi:hypothetical protein